MLRIRLRRVGKTKKAYYRMVVADQYAKRDGDFLETVGSYDPHSVPPKAVLETERIQHWISKGAQPSESAAKILKREGVIAGSSSASAVAVAERPEQAKPPAPEAPTPMTESEETASAREAPAEAAEEA